MTPQLFLERLGLSPRESTVYLTLLEHGVLGVSDIARKSGLYRTEIYQALAHLREELLVDVIPKGKYRAYKAASPALLERKYLAIANEFDRMLAELGEMEHRENSERPLITYHEGLTAISAVYDDVVETLKKGDVYYRYSSAITGASKKRESILSKKYRQLRDQKQIERKVITNVPNKAQKRERAEREIKVIPPDFDLFEYNISQLMYGNKVAVLDYNSNVAVVIDNPTIARFQKKIFELLFRKL
jgi:sugar-specific transcriptional regulator TrmB